jgi:hypothetical protein
MITAAVVVIAVIIFPYITDRLPGILGDTFTRASIEAASVGGLVVRDPCRYHPLLLPHTQMTIELAFRSADEAKQFEIIAALTEGTGIRATARITGVNRETVGTLALRVASVD